MCTDSSRRAWQLPGVRGASRYLLMSCALAFLVTPTTVGGQEEEPAFHWSAGPMTARLGRIAQLDVPEGFVFLGEEAGTLLELMGNPSSGTELGIVASAAEDESWMIIFDFDDIGYVKDDEKDELDAVKILESISAANEAANDFRRERGIPPIRIVGWDVAPRYNAQTNLLEWCIRGESQGEPILNFNTRLLGRRGVMSANLIVDPAELAAMMPVYEDLLDGFSFTSGNRYAEYKKGDRIAELGLTALVAGGAGALALKTGFFKKFFKLIIVAAVAVAGAIGRFARRLFGSKEREAPSA